MALFPKTTDPAKRIELAEARKRDIAARAEALRSEAGELQAQVGAAVAAGDDPAALRAQLHAATAELGELGLAAPHLEQEISAAKSAIAAADRAAKRKAVADLLSEAAGTAESIDEAMSQLQAALRRRIAIGERLQAAASAAGYKAHGFRPAHLPKWLHMQLHIVFRSTEFDHSAPMARPLVEVDGEYTRAEGA